MADEVKDEIARHTDKSVYRVVNDLFLIGQEETVFLKQIYSIVSKIGTELRQIQLNYSHFHRLPA